MSECNNCHKDLPRPIDEFGDLRKPLCITCWLNGAGEKDYVKDDETDDVIYELESDIEDLEAEADSLQSRIDEIEDEISEKRRKIRELKGTEKVPVVVPTNKLDAWVNGKPIK